MNNIVVVSAAHFDDFIVNSGEERFASMDGTTVGRALPPLLER